MVDSTSLAVAVVGSLIVAAIGATLVYFTGSSLFNIFDGKPWEEVVTYVAFSFVAIMVAALAIGGVCRSTSACKWRVVVLTAIILALVLVIPTLMAGFHTQLPSGQTFTISDSIVQTVSLFGAFALIAALVLSATCVLDGPLESLITGISSASSGAASITA